MSYSGEISDPPVTQDQSTDSYHLGQLCQSRWLHIDSDMIIYTKSCWNLNRNLKSLFQTIAVNLDLISDPTSDLRFASVSVCAWVCETYIVHHFLETGPCCAPPTCIVHHRPVLCNIVHKGDLCLSQHSFVLIRWCTR